jgi:hypothetical protein
MVDTRKHLSYPLVYRLLKVALTLPIATSIVERSFFCYEDCEKCITNKIGDEFLSFSLIFYVEKGHLDTVSNETIVDRFHKMQGRRGSELKSIVS